MFFILIFFCCDVRIGNKLHFIVKNLIIKYKYYYKSKDEIEKCILVCANCHGEIHAGLISQDLINLIYNKDKPLVGHLGNAPSSEN